MSLTRAPLTLIQPIGINVPGNPVKTDGSRLLVSEDTLVSPEIILTSGSFDSAQGVLTLVFKSGKVLQVSGFLTPSSIGRGEKGDTGLSGINGIPGVDGVNGLQGYRGLTGPQGLKGEKGEVGADGTEGLRGEQGEQGPQGAVGANCGGTGDGSGGILRPTVSDIDAVGILSSLTYLRGDGTWATLPPQAPPLPHYHDVPDILATGVASNNTYLRGDGTWSELPPQAPPLYHKHNIVDINATGFLTPTTFLRGDGKWAEIEPSDTLEHTHSVSQIDATGDLTAMTFLRGDAVWSELPQLPPIAHEHVINDLSTSGVPSASTFLRGDGVWSSLPPPVTHTHELIDIETVGQRIPTNFLSGAGTWIDPFVDGSSNYPTVTTIDGTEEFCFIKGGVAYKAPLDFLNSYRRFGKMVTITNIMTPTINIDLSQGDTFNITLMMNATINVVTATLPNPPCQFLLRIKQGGAGNFSIVWNTIFKHPNDTAPGIGTDAGDIDVFLCQHMETNRIEISKADGPFKS